MYASVPVLSSNYSSHHVWQEIAGVKESAEKDLEAAKPALESALAALNSITPKDIASLKALKNPPDIVKRIFDCVLLLRQVL